MGKQFVVLDVWTVERKHIPRAFLLMGLQRRPIRRTDGLSFWKLMGTGSGRTFTIRDADPTQWAILSVWTQESKHQAFRESKVLAQWQAISKTHAHLELEPLSAKGSWQKQNPFKPEVTSRWTGPTAALTRARIKPRWWISFWRAVPPVSFDLNKTDGLIASIGIGEAPVGLQGTFSVWHSMDAITQFASRQQPHQKVVARTAETGWYAEELFARFKVLRATGELAGINLDQIDLGDGNE